MIFGTNQHKKLLNDLNEYIEGLINQNNALREELNNWNKDDEIQKWNDKYDNVVKRSIHVMSDKELKDWKEFRELHYSTCKGNTTYILQGTGIGMAVTIKCTKCKAEKDITDIDNW